MEVIAASCNNLRDLRCTWLVLASSDSLPSRTSCL